MNEEEPLTDEQKKVIASLPLQKSARDPRKFRHSGWLWMGIVLFLATVGPLIVFLVLGGFELVMASFFCHAPCSSTAVLFCAAFGLFRTALF